MDLDEPRATARAAADHAGVTVTDGTALDAPVLAELATLVGQGVGARGTDLSPDVLWGLGHVGAPLAVAHADGELLGAIVGSLGQRDDALRLHVHAVAVRPDAAGRGIGRALCWHQRAWSLDRGVTTVAWTLDPLVRREAVVGLVHLGARPVSWVDDLVGRSREGLPTDRMLVSWDLADARVRQAAAGRVAEPRIEGLRRAGAEVVLDADAAGAPVLSPTGAPRRLARVPADVASIRTSDRDLAAAWAAAAREAIGGAMRDGMRVTGVTRDGWYVLAAPGGVAEMA